MGSRGVADKEVNANRGGEADNHRQRKDLPKIDGRRRSSDNKKVEQSDGGKPTSECSTVMGDQRLEVAVYFFDAAHGDVHVLQILGNKNSGHAHDHNRNTSQEHAYGGKQQEDLANAI